MFRLRALTLLVLVLLQPAFGEGAKPETPGPCDLGSSTMADFAGTWSNENQSTGMITRISIDQQFDKALVHAWVKCRPNNCDWGIARTQASEASNGQLQVEWQYGLSVRKATLTLVERGRLIVRTTVHFSPSAGRSDYDTVDHLVRTLEEASEIHGK
ncbi:hypothetical protein [Bradyrhizobium neotropicale]|nr:hypothetical protein [Bradyrhizobium neotropicale]